jgi:hypothetical protein
MQAPHIVHCPFRSTHIRKGRVSGLVPLNRPYHHHATLAPCSICGATQTSRILVRHTSAVMIDRLREAWRRLYDGYWARVAQGCAADENCRKMRAAAQEIGRDFEARPYEELLQPAEVLSGSRMFNGDLLWFSARGLSRGRQWGYPLLYRRQRSSLEDVLETVVPVRQAKGRNHCVVGSPTSQSSGP